MTDGMTNTAGGARTATTGKQIEPGLVARVVQGVRYMLSGIAPNDWMGPSQPLAPIAQNQAQGRAFDFPVGINTQIAPRATEGVSFGQLRALADACDLVRLAIETRKDQMARLQWQIKPKDETKNAEDDPRCKAIEEQLQYPDREHDWDTWLRAVLEELFVIDAPVVYPRMNRGGGVYSLDLMDGSTIKRVVTAEGRTPMAPDPAYQQILKGVPAVDYTRDELLYIPRNVRVSKLYGYSPVEQIIMTINIALRRAISQLDYYTEGNIPDAMYTVPEAWSADQLKTFQMYWDAMLEGSQAQKRHAKFIPGGISALPTRDPKLKDEMDEWLARVVCYAFSLPPTALIKQVNRATGEQAQDTADEEGIAPTMNWTVRMMNQILSRWFQAPDLCFAWAEEEAQDPLQQASVAKIYLDTKVLHPDEVRADLGREPLTEQQKADLNPPMPGFDEGGAPIEPAQPGAAGKPKSGEKEPPAKGADKFAKKKSSHSSTVTGQRSRNLARGYRRY